MTARRFTLSLVGRLSTFFLVSLFVFSACAQVNFDKAFEMQEGPANKRLTVDSDVHAEISRKQNAVSERYEEKERARAEEWRRSSDQASTDSGSNDGASMSSGSDRKVKTNSTSPSRKSTESTVRIRTFWQLKGEVEQVIARCGNGKEVGYTYHVKTTRFCTPSMTCNSDEAWIQRALCY